MLFGPLLVSDHVATTLYAQNCCWNCSNVALLFLKNGCHVELFSPNANTRLDGRPGHPVPPWNCLQGHLNSPELTCTQLTEASKGCDSVSPFSLTKPLSLSLSFFAMFGNGLLPTGGQPHPQVRPRILPRAHCSMDEADGFPITSTKEQVSDCDLSCLIFPLLTLLFSLLTSLFFCAAEGHLDIFLSP